MGQHVVRRGGVSTPARRPEALPTTELSEQEVRSLLRDYARVTEPVDLEPGVEVTHGEPGPGAEPASSAAAAPRFAHTLRREPGAPGASISSLAPPASPADDRADISTIAMPRLERPPLENFDSVATALPVPPTAAPAKTATPMPAETATPAPGTKRRASGVPRLASRPRLEAALPAPRLMATDAIAPLAAAPDAIAPLAAAPDAIEPSPHAVEPRRPAAPAARRWLVVLPIAMLLIIVAFAVMSGLAHVFSDAPLTLP
jgi:hypothetical protein